MDLFALKSLLLLLFFTGCCAGQDVLPVLSPVDAIMGENVTLRMLVDKPSYIFIIWNYSDGTKDTHVATRDHFVTSVNVAYKGRASINPTNGYLTLGPLKMEDSGFYSIHIITDNGSTRSGEIHLRVLIPTTSRPISAPPETTKQCTGYTVALIICAAVIIILLSGYPLLYKWMENRRSRPSNGRNVELSANQLGATSEDSTYQVLNPACMDQDQTYSTLK